MRIAFFTEAGYTGKVPRNNPNMRTDMAWVCALDATHHPLATLHDISSNLYDIGIIIVPKNKQYLFNMDVVDHMKRICTKIAFMQESTYWYWQGDSIESQVWYYTLLQSMDLILCHNDHDLLYYKGITNVQCELMPSLMITDNCSVSNNERSGVMVGGNWVTAYRGIDSYIIGKLLSDDIYAPTTGRMKPEERMLDINHLSWIVWTEWIYELSKRKYGVQLGTAAAGTFNLNCSYLGIPCIGYDNVNTQKYLHPSLCVADGDLYTARLLAERLKKDDQFYIHCSDETKQLYESVYSEQVFKNNMNIIFNKLIKNN
jgi:hypothetical protein